MTIDAIAPGARVLCAVSGGVDSMYLLHRMTELAAQLVTNVPVWRMDCRADESAVRALEDYLRRA